MAETGEFSPPDEAQLIELLISKDVGGIEDILREASQKLSCQDQVYIFQCLIGKVQAYNQRVRNADRFISDARAQEITERLKAHRAAAFGFQDTIAENRVKISEISSALDTFGNQNSVEDISEIEEAVEVFNKYAAP